MDALGVIGFIVLIVVLVLLFSLLGWAGKLMEKILEFIGEGCSSSIGCFFWIFVILAFILALLGQSS